MIDSLLMNHLELAGMNSGEEHQTAIVLSLAMVNNPIHRAVLKGQGKSERQRLEGMFLEMLRERPGEVFVVKRESTIVGVLRSQACHGNPTLRQPAAVEDEVDKADLSDIDARIAYWLRIWEEHDPLDPHRHLGPVGVLPQFQGHGIGSKMMERFCAHADANSEPAFLETDSPENVVFYKKSRFELIDEIDILGVKNYFMWRPAQ